MCKFAELTLLLSSPLSHRLPSLSLPLMLGFSHPSIQYILETSVYTREPKAMKELREVTTNHPWSIMTTSTDEGQFLNMMLKLINANKTMEIVVYTGYSLLATALALPEDGKVKSISKDFNQLGSAISASLSKELVFLILQFLDEEKFKETVHKLEKEFGL